MPMTEFIVIIIPLKGVLFFVFIIFVLSNQVDLSQNFIVSSKTGDHIPSLFSFIGIFIWTVEDFLNSTNQTPCSLI